MSHAHPSKSLKASPCSFDEPITRLESLACASCSKIPEDPNFGCEEEHIVCMECLANHASAGRSLWCPSHVEPPCVARFARTRSAFLGRQLSALRRRCPNAHHGCSFVGPQAQFTPHVTSECSFRTERCVCGDDVLLSDARTHRARDCAEATLYCERRDNGCGQILKRKDALAHAQTCKFHACAYRSKGCCVIGVREDTERHENQYCKPLQYDLAECLAQNSRLGGELREVGDALRSRCG